MQQRMLCVQFDWNWPSGSGKMWKVYRMTNSKKDNWQQILRKTQTCYNEFSCIFLINNLFEQFSSVNKSMIGLHMTNFSWENKVGRHSINFSSVKKKECGGITPSILVTKSGIFFYLVLLIKTLPIPKFGICVVTCACVWCVYFQFFFTCDSFYP